MSAKTEKLHSAHEVAAYERLGWALVQEFRDESGCATEYILEWAGDGEPVRPEPATCDGSVSGHSYAQTRSPMARAFSSQELARDAQRVRQSRPRVEAATKAKRAAPWTTVWSQEGQLTEGLQVAARLAEEHFETAVFVEGYSYWSSHTPSLLNSSILVHAERALRRDGDP